MSIILQFIGSLLLVLNQVFKSKQDLIMEQKSTVAYSPNLDPKQIKKNIKNHIINILGFLYLLSGYLIQLFNFDIVLNIFFNFDSKETKLIMILVILTITQIVSSASQKLLFKKMSELDKGGVEGRSVIYFSENAPAGEDPKENSK